MDPVSISVTPPPSCHAKGHSLDSDASLTGDYASLEKRGKIRQWIEDIDQIDSFHTRSSVAGTELNSVVSSEDSRCNGHNADGSTMVGSDVDTPLAKEVSGLDSLLDDDFDAEDDFFVEAALSALEKGRTAFDTDDFPAADAYLREALVMIKELARKQQSVCDTWELRRMLGVCAFHVHSAAEAEHALVSVLENAPKNAILNEAQRLQVSETAHLLAQVYVKLGKTDKGYRYCEYALRGRRKVLGKSSEQSYDSLALMARILELQNNAIRAEFFIGMIPEADRHIYLSKFSDLSATEYSAVPTNEVLPSDAVSSVSVQKQAPGGDEGTISPPKAPAIPERSPSRGSMSPPRSIVSAMTPATSTVSALRTEEMARPISALSGLASAKSSEHGDARTVSSVVSAAGSPDALAAAYGSLPPQPPPEYSTHAQPRKLRTPDRPNGIRSHSHSGSLTTNSLPAISEPSSPSTMQEQLNMFPQPLRTVQAPRHNLVSELPGDSQYSGGSNPTLNAKRERLASKRLPDPPRSVPPEMEVLRKDFAVAQIVEVQPTRSDRDRLPSRNTQKSSPVKPVASSSVSRVRTENTGEQQSQPLQSHEPTPTTDRIDSPTVPAGNPQADLPSPPPAAQELDIDQLPEPKAVQISHGASPPAQPFKQAPPQTPDATAQQTSWLGPVTPDAQRSDFQRSEWTPPIEAPSAERYGNLPYMPPTNHFAAQPPALPPPSMPNVERWAVQYVAPSEPHPADRQSITSSSYSDTASTVQSHPSSHQTPSTVDTGFSQDSGKSKRKTSLLKVFRAHSSSMPTARAGSITYLDGVRLTRTDIDSIKNDVLTDAAIDFWQEHLEADLLKRSTKFVLMRPLRTALLQESSNDPASLKAALPDFTPGEAGTLHVFIPLPNPRKPSHRSLLLISPQDGLACHYDPRQPLNRKAAEDLTAHISAHLSKPLEFYDVSDVPQVLNDKDSGAFVCMFMQHLILKLENTHVSEKVNAGLECRVDGKSARKAMSKVVESKRKGGPGA